MSSLAEKSHDTAVLRDLAKRYADACADPRMEVLRDLWRRHNSLEPTRPLIYTRAFAWQEMPESQCVCEDPLFREHEEVLRHRLYWYALGDDSIFEPWLTVEAVHVAPPGGPWGFETKWVSGDDPRGSRRIEASILRPEEAARIASPHHAINEDATRNRADRLRDAIGDVLPVAVNRAPVYRSWQGDLSTALIQMRGLDQVMVDALERPDWLHGVLAFMRDGVLRAQAEAEQAGDWSLLSHQNQAMPYSRELPDPAMDGAAVAQDQLWGFCAAQETTLWGPAMFDEFMFQYQAPIMARFGLVAYGCCEDLTGKVGILRRLPNLRRVAVSPMADAARCAEMLGTDYVLSYRPSPSDMVGYDFDEDRIRRILRRDLGACRECHVDITLKDVETVQNDPARVLRWVEITREIIGELW